MQIFLGADHRGFKLKEQVAAWLKEEHHQVMDVGTYNDQEGCDYPPLSRQVALEVVRHPGSRGILLCLTGIGHSIAANKVPGIYAALVYNKEAASLSRAHNDSNVLVIGSKFVNPLDVREIIALWLATPFDGGRHLRRKEQIQNIEKEFCK